MLTTLWSDKHIISTGQNKQGKMSENIEKSFYQACSCTQHLQAGRNTQQMLFMMQFYNEGWVYILEHIQIFTFLFFLWIFIWQQQAISIFQRDITIDYSVYVNEYCLEDNKMLNRKWLFKTIWKNNVNFLVSNTE